MLREWDQLDDVNDQGLAWTARVEYAPELQVIVFRLQIAPLWFETQMGQCTQLALWVEVDRSLQTSESEELSCGGLLDLITLITPIVAHLNPMNVWGIEAKQVSHKPMQAERADTVE